MDAYNLWKEVRAPLDLPEPGTPVELAEVKIRTRISQYLTPPKSDPLMQKMLWWVDRMRKEDLPQIKVCDFHDLIKATEVQSIIDCAEMAARASLFRTESRWGLSHYRLAYPKRDPNWDGKYVVVKKNMSTGEMEVSAKPVPEYKWDYPARLEYEYPEMKLDIGKGFVHPPNDSHDPWISGKVAEEGLDIPKRMSARQEG